VESFWFTDENLDATFIELTDQQAKEVIDKKFRFLQFNHSFKQGDDVFLLQFAPGGDLKFAPGTIYDRRKIRRR
jgi:hypothetical protein